MSKTTRSRDFFADMLHMLYNLQSKCSSVTPAAMRDTVHHLEDALHNGEITKEEYDLSYRDLVAIGQEFSDSCSCVRLSKKPRLSMK